MRRSHPVVGLVIAWLLVGGAVAPVLVGGTAGDATAVQRPALDAPALARAENNSTAIRHENPERRDRRGNLSDVQQFLAGRMGEIVVDCNEGIRVGNLDACDRLNGSYPDYLSKYVDVAGRTDTESDDRAGEAFNETRRDQREFADSVRSFRSLYREYRRARENGNTEKARRLGRRLRERGHRIGELNARLNREYTVLENGTGVDLTASRIAVNETTSEVSDTVSEIEADLFTPTSLTARAGSSTASFRDPVVVTGRLRNEAGTPLTHRRIVLETPGGRRVVETDDDGEYRLVYRPTVDRAGERTYRVRYAPAPASEYLGSNATATVTIEPVTPAVTLTATPDRLAFGDRVRVAGRLAVDDVGAAGVPVVVSIGGVRVARVNTTENGSFAARATLPAAVDPGEQPVVAETALRGRAIAHASAAGRTTVETTGTALTARARQLRPGNASVRVSGRLATADGAALAGQEVVVLFGGTPVGRSATNGSGQFGTIVSLPPATIPESGADAESVTVRYAGEGTNLDGSNASAGVTMASGPGGDGWLSRDALRWVSIALTALGLSVIGAYLYRRRSAPAPPPGDETVGAPPAAASTGPDGAAGPESEPLAAARAALGSAEPERAVLASYAAVRRALAADGDEGQTHWEFLRTCARNGYDDERLEGLEVLTERFEQAAFSPVPVSRGDAEDAFSAARSVIDG